MKKEIHVPRGGLPKWHAPETPDSPFHRKVRMGLFVVSGVSFATVLFAYFIDPRFISNMGLVLMSLFLVISIPVIESLVRPGKGKCWLIAILIVPLLPIFFIFFLVIFPLGLLTRQFIENRK